MPTSSVENTIAQSVVHVARNVDARVIVALTLSGKAAELVQHYKPHCVLVAITPNVETYDKLTLLEGVLPHLVQSIQTLEDAFTLVPGYLIEHSLIDAGERFVLTAGLTFGKSGSTNMIVVLTA